MFTGLIDDVGTVQRIASTDAGRELTIACRYTDLVEGESVAVNGACLTVRECGPQWMRVAAVETTLGRTIIQEWQEGTRVNLERALRLGDRLGGHLVQGHVDGVGEVIAQRTAGDALLIDIRVPPELMDLMVMHGSLTVDGVSLTVNDLPNDSNSSSDPNVVQISLIEYTLRHTTLGALHEHDRVHIEGDMMGKYARQLLQGWRHTPRQALVDI